jgi:hypothetical protein
MDGVLDHCCTTGGGKLGPMRVTQSPSRLLGAILVLGLVGHLWMQTAHAWRSGSRPLDDSRLASSHDGPADHPHEQPADHHPQQCTTLASGDQPLNHPPRTVATAVGALPDVMVNDPTAALRASPATHLQPRSPTHGVVLLL